MALFEFHTPKMGRTRMGLSATSYVVGAACQGCYQLNVTGSL